MCFRYQLFTNTTSIVREHQMGIIKIETTNSKLSYVLHKHPDRPLIRQIRNGYGICWFQDGSCYLYFTDDPFKNSFVGTPKEANEFDYLNMQQYTSPSMYLALMQEFLNTCLKKTESEDVPSDCTINISQMVFSERLRRIFVERCTNIDIVTEPLEGTQHSKVSIVGKQVSLHYLSNFVCFCLMVAGKDELEFDATQVTKYVSKMAEMDLPFYMRSRIALDLIKSPKDFERLKTVLNQSSTQDMSIQFGGTQLQRRHFLYSHLAPFPRDIVDIGCGEGYHSTYFAGILSKKDLMIYAIDKDPDCLNSLSKKCTTKEITNIATFSSLKEFCESEPSSEDGFDVILSEVIEHMPLSDVCPFINQILDTIDFRKVIISTPDKSFNQQFGLADHEFRHDDHHWEMTFSEFQDLVNKLIVERSVRNDIKVAFKNVGSRVGAAFVTSACIITKLAV